MSEGAMGVATYIKDEKDAIKEVMLQSGIKVKTVYTPADLRGWVLSTPRIWESRGIPFTRSIHPRDFGAETGHSAVHGVRDTQQTNERFKLMIAHGQTG